MDNILIIKTGAAGDVVRTTSLLNVLDGNIYWVTAGESKLLFPDEIPGLTIVTVKDAFESLKTRQFTQVISLEEDDDCARLAGGMNTNELIGIYSGKNGINYTDNSAYWFDMSRVSKFGFKKANELKKENPWSYQDCIFRMLGKKFNAEPYRIFNSKTIKENKLIGIEKRTGKQWPDKQWWGYDELIARLEREGHKIKVFQQRDNIRDYVEDIAGCSHIVSGDTLAMHLALACKKTCTAIFNCTSPQEIYDYGLLRKVVSPLLNQYFYSSSFDKEVIESISLDEVYKSLPL